MNLFKSKKRNVIKLNAIVGEKVVVQLGNASFTGIVDQVEYNSIQWSPTHKKTLVVRIVQEDFDD